MEAQSAVGPSSSLLIQAMLSIERWVQQEGQKKPLALCVHPQLPPTTLPRHLPVAVLSHKAGCPLRGRLV